MLVRCHVAHFLMVGEFLGPEGFPRIPGLVGHGKSLPLLACIIEHAHGDGMFDPGVDHCFGADGEFHMAKDGCCSCFLMYIVRGLLISIGWSNRALLSSNMVLVMREKQSKIWKMMSQKVL